MWPTQAEAYLPHSVILCKLFNFWEPVSSSVKWEEYPHQSVFVSSQWEVFEEFGKLPETVCTQWIVAIIIIYKDAYCYFTFLTNLVDHKAQPHVTWRLILDQPQKNTIK